MQHSNPGFQRGTVYNNIKQKLEAAKSENRKKLLNIHIPGTGGRKDDGYPTYTALSCLDNNPVVIYLEGIAASGTVKDPYIDPARNNPLSLEPIATRNASVFASVYAASTSNAEGIAANSSALANIVSLITGAGDKTNNERIVNTLRALDLDKTLPDEIFLSGHSRGAVNCISMANEIYLEFGDKIKINICITDPVPGPLNHNDAFKRVIPPNVLSFTCIYAERGPSAESNSSRLIENGFYATGAEEFVVTNLNTTVTCYMVPGRDHVSVLNSAKLTRAVHNITHAVNGSSGVFRQVDTPASDCPTEKMFGLGARKNIKYHRVSPISSFLPDDICEQIIYTRQLFDPTCELILKNDKPNSESFNYHYVLHQSRAEREEFLKAVFADHKNGVHQSEAAVQAYRELAALQKYLIKTAYSFRPNDNQKWYEICFDYGNQKKKIAFITSDQRKVLEIIKRATKHAKSNASSSEWIKAQTKIMQSKIYQQIELQKSLIAELSDLSSKPDSPRMFANNMDIPLKSAILKLMKLLDGSLMQAGEKIEFSIDELKLFLGEGQLAWITDKYNSILPSSLANQFGKLNMIENSRSQRKGFSGDSSSN